MKSMRFIVGLFSYTHVLITLKSLAIHITQSIKLRVFATYQRQKTMLLAKKRKDLISNRKCNKRLIVSVALLALFHLQIFSAHNNITNTKCNEKITVLLIQPNPTHHMCWKMRPNPTQPMDGTNPCPSLRRPKFTIL